MDTLVELERKLKELENAIADINGRLPAHSVKPSHIANLFDLEDEYDRILIEINQLKSKMA